MISKHIMTNLTKVGEAAIYFVFGVIILLIGRVVWNLLTKYNVNNEIGETDNVSAGIAEFGFLIALALIIMASLTGARAAKIPLFVDLLISLIWIVFGFIALAIGKLILDIFTPFKLDSEISEDRNESAGWLQAGFYVAIALILYAVI